MAAGVIRVSHEFEQQHLKLERVKVAAVVSNRQRNINNDTDMRPIKESDQLFHGFMSLACQKADPAMRPPPTMYMADPFDAYFARARLDELEAKQNPVEAARRGSLPSPGCTLRVEEPAGCRRTRSCKLPSRKSPRRASSKSPSPRRTSGDNSVSRSHSPATSEHSSSPSNNNGGISLSYVTERTLRAPSPRISGRCHSAPHSRNASWKKQKRPRSMRGQEKTSGEGSPESPEHRSRSGSGSVNFENEVAAKLEQLRVLQAEDVCPVRNFSASRRGLVNRGDSFKRKSRHGASAERELPVLGSVDDGHDQHRLASPGSPDEVHKVIVTGDNGVGKTALLQQFMTSDYMAAIATNDDEFDKTVSVSINGEESMIEFIDSQAEQPLITFTSPSAYVLVYSITSKTSFQYVLETLKELRHTDHGQKVAIIVVANKSDLVRTRVVSEDDAKDTCNHYDCKYIEVSAALNLQVDELLVGIVTQIRLNCKRQEKLKQKSSTNCVKSAKGFLSKLFLRKPQYHVSKSCDNLLDL